MLHTGRFVALVEPGMTPQEATPEEIEQAAHMCAALVRKGHALAAAIESMRVIRDWDSETCREVEQRVIELRRLRKR